MGAEIGAPQRDRQADAEAPAERAAGCLGDPANLVDEDLIGLRRQHRFERAELPFDAGGVGHQPKQ